MSDELRKLLFKDGELTDAEQETSEAAFLAKMVEEKRKVEQEKQEIADADTVMQDNRGIGSSAGGKGSGRSRAMAGGYSRQKQ
ncbi:hypothetical protein LTR66_016057 [Elasticomyces elasticus]|nr:hypothetical protein LTR66_016057 [Elasticomyces elasticus]